MVSSRGSLATVAPLLTCGQKLSFTVLVSLCFYHVHHCTVSKQLQKLGIHACMCININGNVMSWQHG